jgi:hypothetical protein
MAPRNPLGPPENTAQRTRRLVEERQSTEADESRVTTMAGLFEAPDGSDNRVYSADGSMTPLDDELSDDQHELFEQLVAEVDEEVIDLGDGAFSGVEGVPPTPAQKAKESRARRHEEAKAVAPADFEPSEPHPRQVLQRPPADAAKQYVNVLALDDIETSIGYNGGKTFKLTRNKVHRVPLYVAKWLINQKLVGPPPQQNWLR